jgi:hypothetical protein
MNWAIDDPICHLCFFRLVNKLIMLIVCFGFLLTKVPNPSARFQISALVFIGTQFIINKGVWTLMDKSKIEMQYCICICLVSWKPFPPNKPEHGLTEVTTRSLLVIHECSFFSTLVLRICLISNNVHVLHKTRIEGIFLTLNQAILSNPHVHNWFGWKPRQLSQQCFAVYMTYSLYPKIGCL